MTRDLAGPGGHRSVRRLGDVRRHRAGRFALGADQHSRPVRELIDADESVRDAAASCPVEAISVTDAETGVPVPLD
jgi:hypothetical protein